MTALAQLNILSAEERKILVDVQQIRNRAVHMPDEPPQHEASSVIAAANQFLARFAADG
jgi:hypothetical protein